MNTNARIRSAARWLLLAGGSFCAVAAGIWLYTRPARLDDSEPPEPPELNYSKPPAFSDEIPWLYQAASLPATDAVALILQNSVHVRTDVAMALMANPSRDSADAASSGSLANLRLGDARLEQTISKKIDEIVRQRISKGGLITSADYPMLYQPSPFTMIIAMKMPNKPFACIYFVMSSGASLTASSVRSDYGEPGEEDHDNEGYPVLRYLKATKSYRAKMEFTLGSSDNDVQKVYVSVDRSVKKD